MNNVMLIGRYHSLNKLYENQYIIFIIISNKDGDLTLPNYIFDGIDNKVKEFCNNSDLLGVNAVTDV